MSKVNAGAAKVQVAAAVVNCPQVGCGPSFVGWAAWIASFFFFFPPVQSLNGTACAKDPAACSTAKAVANVATYIVVVLAAVLQTVYPGLGVLVNCQYVAELAKVGLLVFLYGLGQSTPTRFFAVERTYAMDKGDWRDWQRWGSFGSCLQPDPFLLARSTPQ